MSTHLHRSGSFPLCGGLNIDPETFLGKERTLIVVWSGSHGASDKGTIFCAFVAFGGFGLGLGCRGGRQMGVWLFHL